MSHPEAPWRLVGQAWASLFRVSGVEDRPDGVYAAAYVSYEPGGVLSYSELLVARVVDARRRALEITDIWVDLPESREGGRELWAIPKELCDFRLESAHTGPVTHTDWAATFARRPIASASFADVSRVAPRLPFGATVRQPGLDAGPRTAPMKGSAKVLPCRASWDFEADGPLAWLAGRRSLGSLRVAGFRMTFG